MYLKLLKTSFVALLILVCITVSAENSKEKQSALKKQINTASANLKNSLVISKKLKRNVRIAEDNLNKLSRDLYRTERSINQLTSKLAKSNALKGKLELQTKDEKVALAQQMQALYTSGKQSHLRLLLKQDDPSDLSRTVKYFEYMNKYRLKRIQYAKKRLNKIKEVQKKISADSAELKALQVVQSKKKRLLKSAVLKKDELLRKQSRIVKSQEQKLLRLKKDESRLREVLRKLAQKQKKELLERAKTKIKPTQETKPKQKIVKSVDRHFVPNRPFSSLRGKLSWPVRGKLLHKYGSARNSKIKWNGVIISAAGGTNVHAVARGKVEFSGRLNGYGYVIIIRHDKSYRSLYAYNRSVYKKVGTIVKAGEIIAAVGNSGRLEKPGLYFEISKGAIHQNPARWCR